MTLTACGMTSLPMPSPGMTAIFFGALTGRKYHMAVAVAVVRWAVLRAMSACERTEAYHRGH